MQKYANIEVVLCSARDERTTRRQVDESSAGQSTGETPAMLSVPQVLPKQLANGQTCLKTMELTI